MAYYLSFDRCFYLSNDEYEPGNHEKKVSLSSAKTNILFDGAIIAKIKFFLFFVFFCHAKKRYQNIFSGEYDDNNRF